MISKFLRETMNNFYSQCIGLVSAPYRESDAKVSSDELISWICNILGGWVRPSDGNLRAFDHAVRKMPGDGAVIEIGSFLGLSACILSYLAWKYGRDNPFYTCDPWAFEEVERPIGGFFDAASNQYRDYSKDVFIKNMEVFCRKKPFSIEAYSDSFFSLWSQGAEVRDVFGRTVRLGGAVSFAYIDGAHTFESARNDFLNIDRHLLDGGFVLFDDSSDYGRFRGVRRAALEVSKDPRYELVFKTPNYFFRKKPQASN